MCGVSVGVWSECGWVSGEILVAVDNVSKARLSIC